MNASTLVWGFVFGTIGFSYLLFGKKRSNTVVIVSGLALMAYPYFFGSPFALVGIGIALTLLPFIWRQ